MEPLPGRITSADYEAWIRTADDCFNVEPPLYKTFCKDYKQGGITKTMQLPDMEFIRRFSLHILPKGFVRIRHFGILSSCCKQRYAQKIKAQLPAIKIPAYIQPKAKPEPYNPKQCPCCKKDTMETLLHFNNRPPPWYWEQLAKDLLANSA